MNLNVISIVLCLLSGCTFSMPQADSMLRWAKSLTNEKLSLPISNPFGWLRSASLDL